MRLFIGLQLIMVFLWCSSYGDVDLLINSSGEAGLGYRFNNIELNAFFSFGGYYERIVPVDSSNIHYDNHDMNFNPGIGIRYILPKKEVDLYFSYDAYTNFTSDKGYGQLWYLYNALSLGVERYLTKSISISGEYGLRYFITKAKRYGAYSYWNSFGQSSAFVMRFYVL